MSVLHYECENIEKEMQFLSRMERKMERDWRNLIYLREKENREREQFKQMKSNKRDSSSQSSSSSSSSLEKQHNPSPPIFLTRRNLEEQSALFPTPSTSKSPSHLSPTSRALSSTSLLSSYNHTISRATLIGHRSEVWKAHFVKGVLPKVKEIPTPHREIEQFVLSCGRDGTARLFSLHSLRCVCIFTHAQLAVYDVQMSPCSRLIATAASDGIVRIWANVITNNHLSHYSPTLVVSTPVRYLMPERKVKQEEAPKVQRGRRKAPYLESLSTSSEGSEGEQEKTEKRVEVLSWQTMNSQEAQPISQLSSSSSTSSGVSFASSPPPFLCGGCSDGSVCVWDVMKGSLLIEYKLHEAPVTTLRWIKNGEIIVSADFNGEICFYDFAGKAPVKIYSLCSHFAPVWSLSTDKEEKVLYSAGSDGTIRLWDLKSILSKITTTPTENEASEENSKESEKATKSGVRSELATQMKYLLNTFWTRSTDVRVVSQTVAPYCLVAGGVFQKNREQ
eukprot:MONOS_15558.1-p1 / transcript=MONOS_15558.1 / gene=MONOS_15558 / organism=Monocercomonoides_exilis_PA203 / gene_product=unspecified product / transcript_product=unspecified product / location=Mono_scaffold01271:2772-5112(-) / protein_length=504 / sequence_SO=supercontig / SO=protein_coding / is_pseudo=false